MDDSPRKILVITFMGTTRIGKEDEMHLFIEQSCEVNHRGAMLTNDFIDDSRMNVQLVSPTADDLMSIYATDLFDLLMSIGKQTKTATTMRKTVARLKKYIHKECY